MQHAYDGDGDAGDSWQMRPPLSAMSRLAALVDAHSASTETIPFNFQVLESGSFAGETVFGWLGEARVSIKRLSDETDRQKLRLIARALRRNPNTHVAPLCDYHPDSEVLQGWCITSWCPSSLEQEMARWAVHEPRSCIDGVEVIDELVSLYAHQLTLAFAHIHAHNIAHLDLRPSKVRRPRSATLRTMRTA